MLWGVSTICQFTQAGLAYFQLIQEEEYVQQLPKFYVLERVHFQQIFAEVQVSYRMIQVEVTSHTLPQLVQAVEQVHCQLL